MTTIYLATGQGISVVRSSEESWEGATQLRDKQVECVLVDPEDSDVAFCGTLGAGLFKTSDAGATWTPCLGFSEASVTSLAAAESGVLFAGTEPSQVLRSDDRGATWFALSQLMELPSERNGAFLLAHIHITSRRFSRIWSGQTICTLRSKPERCCEAKVQEVIGMIAYGPHRGTRTGSF
jgi:hypothetical protein